MWRAAEPRRSLRGGAVVSRGGGGPPRGPRLGAAKPCSSIGGTSLLPVAWSAIAEPPVGGRCARAAAVGLPLCHRDLRASDPSLRSLPRRRGASAPAFQSALAARSVGLRGSGEVAPSAPRAGGSGTLPRGVVGHVHATSAPRATGSTRRPRQMALLRSGSGATLTASGELVGRQRGGGIGLRALRGQFRQRAFDLTDDAPDGDAEHALAALDEVDDLVR